MADKNDRPSAEYSLPGAAKPERLSVPRLGPLVAGKVQAPKPNVPPPPPPKPRLADMRPVHAPRNQRTMVGAVAPPGPGNQVPPVPLPAPELDSTLESPQPAPREHVPPYFDQATAERPTLQRKIEQQGDKLVHAPISTPTPFPSPAPKSSAPPRALKLELGDLKGWAALLTALGGLGLGAWAKASTPTQAPAVADAPAQIAELRSENARLRERLTTAERDVDDVRAGLRRVERKLEQTIGEVERVRRSVPRIEGVSTER
jgi:hypothetical protein